MLNSYSLLNMEKLIIMLIMSHKIINCKKAEYSNLQRSRTYFQMRAASITKTIIIQDLIYQIRCMTSNSNSLKTSF